MTYQSATERLSSPATTDRIPARSATAADDIKYYLRIDLHSLLSGEFIDTASAIDLLLKAGGVLIMTLETATGDVGIGVSPVTRLHIKELSDDVELRVETDKVNGRAILNLLNDAQEWHVRCQTDDNFHIRDVTGTKTVFVIEKGAAENSFYIDSNGKVVIGGNSPSPNADLSLEGGVLNLKETTTPTADADYGKVYFKSDNKLYCQDGAGVEHEIAFV